MEFTISLAFAPWAPTAVSFGAIHLRTPWKPTSIVRKDMITAK